MNEKQSKQSLTKNELNSTVVEPSELDQTPVELEKSEAVKKESEKERKTINQQPTILEHITTTKMTLP